MPATASFSSLQQTPQPQAPFDPATGPQAVPPQTSDDLVNQYVDRLNTRLAQLPVPDYNKMAQPAIQATQDRPVDKMPGGLQMFAAALGSPQNAPAILSQRQGAIERQKSQKNQDLLELQESLLHANIAAAVQKGDFQRALVQQQELMKLQPQLDQVKRTNDLHDYAVKNGILYQNKAQLAQQTAQDRMQAKIHEAAATYHLPERLLEDEFKGMSSEWQSKIKTYFKPNPFTGEPELSPQDYSQWQSDYETAMNNKVQEILHRNPAKAATPAAGAGATPAPAAAPAASAATPAPATETPFQAALRKRKEAKSGGK